MRTTLMAAALAALAAAPALAQPGYGAVPPGSYQRQCTNIRMEGQFLHATCRGAHGAGDSSINVQSCSTGIFVDDSGALSCIGPGGGAPPQVRNAPPGYNTGQGQGYNAGQGQGRGYNLGQVQGRGYNPGEGQGYDRGAGGYGRPGGERQAVTLFERRSWRGQPVEIRGPAPDLRRLSEPVRSIQLDRRSGPWLVCSDPGYRGRCVTIRDSVSDTRSLGLRDIASLRPQ